MIVTNPRKKWVPLLALSLLYGCGKPSPSMEEMDVWYKNAKSHVTAKEYNKALELLDSVGINSIDPSNHLLKGKAYHLRGYAYWKLDNEIAELTNYYYALDELKKVNEPNDLSRLLNDIAQVYRRNNKLEKALKHYQEAYSLLEDDQSQELKILNNIAGVYEQLEDYEQALEHFHKGLIIADKINNNSQKAALLNNIGEVHRIRKEYKDAEKNYLQAIPLYKKSGKQQKVAYALNNLALVYQETQQWDKSLDYFQQSVKIKEKYNDPALNNGYNNLAGLYLEKQDFKKANHYLDKALALNSPKPEDRSKTLRLKAGIAKKQGKPEQWGRYLEQSLALKDSIHNKQDTINDLSYKNLLLVQERVEHENTMHKARIGYQQQVNRWVTIAVVVALVGITVITILYWRLRQATLTMDTYTKNMSHTMRNQFNAILGNAYIVKGLLRKMKVSPEEDTRPEAYEAIRSIGDILQSSAETTTNIITTRHVGKVQAESDLYKPVRAVAANLKTYTPAAREKGIVLKEEVLSTPSVTAHATTFEHALGNLVSNAIKYSPEGSTVTIRLYDRNNRVFLKVLDEGPGIAAKDKKKLFKKGVKLHHIKNIVSSGVGLYYAKRDVEAMGGKMYHENRPEGGSAFTIEFPKTV